MKELKIAIYTAVIPESFDPVYAHEDQNIKVDLHKFNNSFLPDHISSLHPRLQAKFFKLQPHRIALLKKYDYVIWIDGSASIISPQFAIEMIEQVQNYPLAVFKHPENRDCIYQEAEYCRNMPKYKDQIIMDQVEAYKLAGYPEHNGLYACGVVVIDLKNQNAINLLDEWWRHNLSYTYQDQLSLPFVSWKLGIKVKVIELDIFNNHLIYFHRNHATTL